MDHNGNQARSGSQLQPGPVCIDRSPSMLNTNHLGRELYSVSTLSLLFLYSFSSPHSVRRNRELLRTNPATLGGRSPRFKGSPRGGGGVRHEVRLSIAFFTHSNPCNLG